MRTKYTKKPYLRKQTLTILDWVKDNPEVLEDSNLKKVSKEIWLSCPVNSSKGAYCQLMSKLHKKGVILEKPQGGFTINYKSEILPKDFRKELKKAHKKEIYKKIELSSATNKGMTVEEFRNWKRENMANVRAQRGKNKKNKSVNTKKVIDVVTGKKEVKQPSIKVQTSKDGKLLTISLDLTIKLGD